RILRTAARLHRREQQSPRPPAPPQDLRVGSRLRAREAGQHYDVELESLGMMERHHLDARRIARIRARAQLLQRFDKRRPVGHVTRALVRREQREKALRSIEIDPLLERCRTAERKPAAAYARSETALPPRAEHREQHACNPRNPL